MKTVNQIIKTGLGTSLTLAVAVAAWLAAPTQVFAQAKGGQRLLDLSSRQTAPKLEARSVVLMSCSKCKDFSVTQANTEAKGAQALVAGGSPTKIVASHLCKDCQTTIGVTGHGKAKQDVNTHKCASCGT